MAYPVKKFEKDPDDILDYPVEWADFLNGDTIDSVEWVFYAPEADDTDPLEMNSSPSSSFTSNTAVVWLRKGMLGKKYFVTCRVTSVGGRVADKTIQLTIKEH